MAAAAPHEEVSGARRPLAALLAAAAASLGLVWAVLPGLPFGGAALGGGIAVAMVLGIPLLFRPSPRPVRSVASAAQPPAMDWTLLSAGLESATEAVVVTGRAGTPVCANMLYEDIFGLAGPFELEISAEDEERLLQAAHLAWREGGARIDALRTGAGALGLRVRRAGAGEDYLIWRFDRSHARNPLGTVVRLVEGPVGFSLASAGVMAAVIDRSGRIQAANALFRQRAFDPGEPEGEARAISSVLRQDETGQLCLAGEAGGADGAAPVRIVQVPIDQGDEQGPSCILLIDEDPAPPPRQSAAASVHGLLAMLPLGLALAERDGRFLFMNEAFVRAAGLTSGEGILYPGDLVVEEDKAIVSEAVRRFAGGRALPGDLAIRLKSRPEEPVALTLAGAKGLGDATVLLSLKDNSEESKLKRQVTQATKMQAVGQLAGGVAHDFNNVLTAIIGHCDLMLMRHSPGDIDHDDIQQIKLNSNRAASLTRQLLAFSRQQTLRPQVLQLPDVVSEVSHLLKRLLGETITLTVKHARSAGYVRADPGQLEQVIVNLAVNARDAMPDGGTLAVRTYGVSAADVRRMAHDIMPVADYVALSVSDTGHGIPPDVEAKIFEPFFTTKEVGRGTGLGLSTVYGIVKQTDGFIFAETQPGEGTCFTIYLPVHQAGPAKAIEPPRAAPAGPLWGTGTILLVEDEAMVRTVAERALGRQGYRVLTAANGEEALELIGREPIDLLISDVVMPTMDGPTLVRHARARMPDLPILFMSGYAEEQLRRSIDINQVSFLAKPFSVQELSVAARDVLAAARALEQKS